MKDIIRLQLMTSILKCRFQKLFFENQFTKRVFQKIKRVSRLKRGVGANPKLPPQTSFGAYGQNKDCCRTYRVSFSHLRNHAAAHGIEFPKVVNFAFWVSLFWNKKILALALGV